MKEITAFLSDNGKVYKTRQEALHHDFIFSLRDFEFDAMPCTMLFNEDVEIGVFTAHNMVEYTQFVNALVQTGNVSSTDYVYGNVNFNEDVFPGKFVAVIHENDCVDMYRLTDVYDCFASMMKFLNECNYGKDGN